MSDPIKSTITETRQGIAAHADGTLCADATLHRAECARSHRYAPAWPVTWRAPFGGECHSTLVGVSFQGIALRASDGYVDHWPTGLSVGVADLLRGLSAVLTEAVAR